MTPPQPLSESGGPSLPPGLARRVHRGCGLLGAPAGGDRMGWLAEQSALALYAAETPVGQSVVQLQAGDGRTTAALAIGTQFAHRPPVWAIDTFTDMRIGGAVSGALEGNLVTLGVARHAVAVTAGPTGAARAWDGSPVGLLVLNASAGVATCMSAYTAWSRHLGDGARIIFHGPVSAAAGRLLWGGPLEPLFGFGDLRVCRHHALPAVPVVEHAHTLRRAA